MESLIQDVRHAIRSLCSSPGFVILSVLCLGLGIGANTTVFSVVNGLLLRPLPLGDSSGLVALHECRNKAPLDAGPVSYPNFRDWQEHGRVVAEMAAIRTRHLTLSDAQHAERYPGALVTWNLFPLLGVQPILGRGFREEEDRAGAVPVVLLGQALWKQRYARDAAVVGRSVIVDGRPHTVVGIMPDFAHPALPGSLRAGRLWIPLTPLVHDSRRDERSTAVFARLAAGVGPDRATTHLTAIARLFETQHPENQGWGVAVRPFAVSLSATTRTMLLLVTGAVSFVLLIACANVANLMLARAIGRRREIAVRTALGATRSRIVRQLLTESVIVGVLSAPPGVMLASWGVGLLLQATAEQANNIALPIDGRVLSFTIALAILTSLVFGLAPALHAVRGDARDALTESGRESTASGSQTRLRNALVVGEVALSLVLLVLASIFVRSFMNLLQAEGGVDTSRLIALTLEMTGDRYGAPDAIAGAVEDVVARLESLPGVESVAASNLTPLRGGGNRTAAFVEGKERHGEEGTSVVYTGVTARFFQTLDVLPLRGRGFSEVEARTHSAVAIVNRRMAERLWPGEDALGRRFRLAGSSAEWHTVIGISPDISNWNLSHRPLPTAYLPYPYVPVRDPRLMIRMTASSVLTADSARAAVHAVDPAIAVFAMQAMDEVHRLAFWRQELVGWLLSVFGASALLLAAIGVYGVLCYVASQRTREIGIRMALGAGRRDVVRLIVRQGMGLVLGGVGLGLAGACAATRIVRGQLYEVSAADPISFVGVALLLAGVGLVASYVPAHRAGSVDPVASLRG